MKHREKFEERQLHPEEYKATIQAYIEKRYLRKVPSDEQLLSNVWYLPHFPVVRMDKATTKVRIVFDCAAKCNGISLNDMIHAGPKLQEEEEEETFIDLYRSG